MIGLGHGYVSFATTLQHRPARCMIAAEGIEPMPPRLYLAGPMVFDPDPEAWFTPMKAICARHGMQGVSPLDNQTALAGHAPGKPLALAIVTADIALMHTMDAGVFCLDGFRRSPEMDPGTAFEIGYMHALGKPLAGWTRDTALYPDRVATFFRDRFGLDLIATAPGVTGATSGALRDPDGVLVHSEGCYQNAMTDMGIERSGGLVAANPDWELAFDEAVSRLATLLRKPA
jgi:nucleoside 2-deoxyribosyltransferase